ncbi:MAG: right-handed parallel beta-helix repeat-containing protein, partial [Elainellaceae cyanobacterium]
IILEGDVAAYGDGVVIAGGGNFVSGTAGRQNAAVIASGTAVVRGVTLSNREGHGLWVEAGAATVSHCLLWGSQQDGVVVGGNSRPTIRHNRFYQNQGNGILVRGTAAPLIQTNRIEDTGYGIAIHDQATPRLLQNYISGNRSGIVIQGRSRPTLRQNHITRNRQDGVVAIAQAQPDLGTQGQPGENQFSGNGQYAINAQTSDQIIAAAGNAFLTGTPAAQLAGRVDTNGVVVPSLRNAPEVARTHLTPQGQNATSRQAALPADAVSGGVPIPVVPPAITPVPEIQNQDIQSIQNQSIQNQPGALPTVAIAAALPLRSVTRQPRDQMAVMPVAATQSVLPRRVAATPPPRNRNLLPVPASRAPLGNMGGRATVSAATGGAQRPVPRYRVLVEARSPQDQALVQAIAPGSFLTRINGSPVMQAGAYQRMENATQMQRQLVNTGLRAQVQQIQ